MIHIASKRGKQYNSTGARKIYFKDKNILKKAGSGPSAKWFCENPDCKSILSVNALTIHHLLPRRISPSLIYKSSNMILLCDECHNEIEQKHQRKKKIDSLYKNKVFCRFCGFQIEFKRDRIGSDCFHHNCLIKFIKSDAFQKYTEELLHEE